MRTTRITALLIATLLVVVPLAGCAGDIEQPSMPTLAARMAPPARIRLGSLATEDVLPLWVAQQQGLFDKVGLAVQIVRFSSAAERDAAFKAGVIDGFVGDIFSVARLRDTGSRSRIVSVCLGATPAEGRFGIVAGPRTRIHVAHQLAGVPVETSSGTLEEFVLDGLMSTRLRTWAVRKEPTEDPKQRYDDLMEGRAAAVVLPEPYLSLAIARHAHLVASDTRGDNLSQTVLAFSDTFLAGPGGPAAVNRLLGVWDRGSGLVNAKRGTYRPLLVEKAGIQALVAKRYRVNHYPHHGLPTQAQVSRALAWMQDKGLLRAAPSYADITWTPETTLRLSPTGTGGSVVTTGPAQTQLAREGTVEWFNTPAAVQHGGKTYFAYEDHRQIEVGCFDDATGKVAPPFVLDIYPKDDDHGSPTLCVIPSGPDAGKILAFYAMHTSALKVRRSSRAGDITAWDPPITIESGYASYPKPRVLADGDVRVFYRYYTSPSSPEVMRVSADGGRSWGARTTLVAGDPGASHGTAAYTFVANRGDEVHVAFTVYDYAEVRCRDVYHAYSTDGGATWRDSGGAPIGLPLTTANCTRVFASAPGQESWLTDLKVAPGGCALAFWDDLRSRHGRAQVRYARLDGGRWTTERVCDGSVFYDGGTFKSWDGRDTGIRQYYPAGASIDPKDPDRLLVAAGESGTYGGPSCQARMELWRRASTGWAKTASVSRLQSIDTSRWDMRPQWVQDYDPALMFVWPEVSDYEYYGGAWSASLVGSRLD